jgi:hypothetical protein
MSLAEQVTKLECIPLPRVARIFEYQEPFIQKYTQAMLDELATNPGQFENISMLDDASGIQTTTKTKEYQICITVDRFNTDTTICANPFGMSPICLNIQVTHVPDGSVKKCSSLYWNPENTSQSLADIVFKCTLN